jgi:hypothetical protein
VLLAASSVFYGQRVGWVERSDTHHLSVRAARRWVSQGLNPSYELAIIAIFGLEVGSSCNAGNGLLGGGMSVWFWLLSPWLALLGLIFWDITNKRSILDPTVLLTGVLALCTAASCVLAFLQWRVLEQTDDTFWAAQRPWLGIKSKIELTAFKITHYQDTKGASVTVKLTINNYGNIPAIKTKTATTAFIDPDPNDKNYRIYHTLVEFDQKVMDAQKVLCTASEDDQETGNSLKPEENTISQRQRLALASEYAFESTDGPSIFPKESSEVFVDADVDVPSEIQQVRSISVAGCFHYSFGENRAGSTFFILKISPSGTPGMVFDVSHDGDITTGTVSLLEHKTRAD